MDVGGTYVDDPSRHWYTLATAAVMILFVELEVGIAFFTFALSSLDSAEGADGMMPGWCW